MVRAGKLAHSVTQQIFVLSSLLSLNKTDMAPVFRELSFRRETLIKHLYKNHGLKYRFLGPTAKSVRIGQR